MSEQDNGKSGPERNSCSQLLLGSIVDAAVKSHERPIIRCYPLNKLCAAES